MKTFITIVLIALLPTLTAFARQDKEAIMELRMPIPQQYADIKGLDKIVYVRKVRISNADHLLVFSQFDGVDKGNDVRMVYLVPANQKYFKTYEKNRKSVSALIYHDLGKDKEFCGVEVYYGLPDDNGRYAAMITLEIRLPDDAANDIINLLTGDSKWNNKTAMRYGETKSPKTMPPKIVGKQR